MKRKEIINDLYTMSISPDTNLVSTVYGHESGYYIEKFYTNRGSVECGIVDNLGIVTYISPNLKVGEVGNGCATFLGHEVLRVVLRKSFFNRRERRSYCPRGDDIADSEVYNISLKEIHDNSPAYIPELDIVVFIKKHGVPIHPRAKTYVSPEKIRMDKLLELYDSDRSSNIKMSVNLTGEEFRDVNAVHVELCGIVNRVAVTHFEGKNVCSIFNTPNNPVEVKDIDLTLFVENKFHVHNMDLSLNKAILFGVTLIDLEKARQEHRKDLENIFTKPQMEKVKEEARLDKKELSKKLLWEKKQQVEIITELKRKHEVEKDKLSGDIIEYKKEIIDIKNKKEKDFDDIKRSQQIKDFDNMKKQKKWIGDTMGKTFLNILGVCLDVLKDIFLKKVLHV